MTNSITTPEMARALGFTREIEWESGDGFGGIALCRPEADIDGEFTAFCLEDNVMMHFSGWALYITEKEQSA